MLKRIAAVLMLAGLVLPYACDVRPITGVWRAADTILLVGLPVLAALAYALHVLLPPLARFHERYGAALHGALRALYFILVGGYLVGAVKGGIDDRLFPLLAVALTGALLWWQQRRGTKAQRLPLLLLIVVGLPAINYFLGGFDTKDLKVGAWVFTAGYLLAVWLEVKDLRRAPPVTHGG